MSCDMLLATLSATHDLRLDEAQEAVWRGLACEYDDLELAHAARELSKTKTYGRPTWPDVVTAIEGRLETVSEPMRDAYGRTILSSAGGPPRTRRVERRVSASGERHGGRAALRESLGLQPLALGTGTPRGTERDALVGDLFRLPGGR